MLIGLVEADELLMAAVTSSKKTRYRVKLPSGDYEPFKDLRTMKWKKDLIMWLAKRGLGHLEVEEYTVYSEFKNVVYQLDSAIKALYRLTKADLLQFYVGPLDGSNFRYKSAKTQPYKSNRFEKPEVLLQLREYVINKYNAEVMTGYEADDALGIYQKCVIDEFGQDITHELKQGDKYRQLNGTIAIHKDKDIFMIPGWHFNTQEMKFEFVEVLGRLWLTDKRKLKGRGLAFFYSQLLMGDSTDTIPSLCKGKYGDVGVFNLLKDCKDEADYLQTVISEYKLNVSELWNERLYEQADLVWIVQEKGVYGSDYIKSKLKELNYDSFN